MHNVPAFLRKNVKSISADRLDDAAESYRPLLAAWLIEMALGLGWYKVPHPGHLPEILADDDFLRFTGIEPPGKRDADGDLVLDSRTLRRLSETTLTRLLKKRLATLYREGLADELPLFANVEGLGRLLGLDAAERALLVFAVAIDAFHSFKSIISSRCVTVTTPRLAQLIAALSGQSESELRAALRQDAPLLATGILQVHEGACDLENKLDLMQGLGGLLLEPHVREEAMVDRFLKRADPPTLALEAFPHLAQDTAVLADYLANAMRSGEPGSNVLFHGRPGTGKTELARALAAAMGADLYEIAFADPDGDPIKGEQRLRAYNLCQKILSRRRNALLMFDEIEDVFSPRSGWLWLVEDDDQATSRSASKAWVNRTLERNATPAVWVTNDPDIDPAYLRRFDYSTKFPIPPQRVRMAIARHHLAQFEPTDDWLARIAANEHTTPAQFERAAKVARLSSGGDHARARMLVEQALDRSANLLGQKRTPARNALRTDYDLSFVNTDADVPEIVAGLKQRPWGTFCFYGPAGTGKSELARHIADQIGRPLVVRRASDLLSMWVGESEKHIAQMFAEARQQDAVLVLDEADSFLADRRNARHGWEITQVNELLTQMEAFEGIFICTTNLMELLDQASLRRFAFKVKFDYLTADQRWRMFLRELVRLGGDADAAVGWEAPVRRLDRLTPGDFAVAARQFELWDTPATPDALFERLRKECEAKEGGRRGIGFCA